jgi:hypothetical protein
MKTLTLRQPKNIFNQVEWKIMRTTEERRAVSEIDAKIDAFRIDLWHSSPLFSCSHTVPLNLFEDIFGLPYVQCFRFTLYLFYFISFPVANMAFSLSVSLPGFHTQNTCDTFIFRLFSYFLTLRTHFSGWNERYISQFSPFSLLILCWLMSTFLVSQCPCRCLFRQNV